MAPLINACSYQVQSKMRINFSSKLARLEWTVVAIMMFLVVPSRPLEMDKKSNEYTFLNAQQAKFARDLSSYDIIIPQKVTETGLFLSHTVHHTMQSSKLYRRKRDTEKHSFTNTFNSTTHKSTFNSDTSIHDQLHYKVNLHNTDLHLVLEPNHKLIAPGFVIERRPQGYKNLSHAVINEYPENQCHFVGHVKGDPDSRVAVGTCHGLHGFLHTSQGQYLIEPVKGHNYTQGGEHPHIIYSRSSLPAHLNVLQTPDSNKPKNDQQEGTCGVNAVYKEAENERESWEKENRKKRDLENNDYHLESKRKRRSISRERYVEVMVVVDKEMLNFYRNEDVQTYVLTIMNMVSAMYHDFSIGNAVNVVLVNLMLMDYDEPKLKVTHHADNTLRSFCRWQKSINLKDDKDPNHHDVAVLLTRRNICSRRNEPCSTLGLSQVNGLCQPHRSCNINEDTGLSLAFTVAHELGHNFGMQHDGPQNGCEAVEGKFQLIMAAQLNAEASPMVWSTCSKEAVTKFLDRDWGYCLDDEPSEHEYYIDERPPGIKYDADHQCRLQYGDDAKYCDGIDNMCTTIWCKVKNKCMTRLEAAAEGTICGDNKWCSGGQCIMQGETPLAQNGEWGEWGGWAACSRTCGAGVAYRQRHCDNPGPRNGGKYCIGERKRYLICNTDACPEDTPNFKDLQCANYDDVPYKGKFYKWQYVVNPRTPCQLHCRPKGHFFSVMLSDMVEDGTSCPVRGLKAMCISGLCRQVGCDWDIDSDAKEDGCGVCRGDGATCQTIKTKFNKEQGMGYVEALVIPEGARNIRIEEVAEANNYLAIRNDDGQYYLNGGWFIQWNGDYEAAGTVITYERVGDKEMLKAPGPIKEDLHIMLLFQSENPGVEFEYTIPNENASELRTPEFKWIYLDWTHCTHSCGGGTQRSPVMCSETELGIVDDIHCNASTRPEDMLRVCNEHICPPRWWPGPWQHCSVSCGGDGVRRRTVLCVRSSGQDVQEALEDWECDDEEKPVEQEACHHKPQCATEGEWQIGPWSDNCAGDPCVIQIRDVYCDDTTLTCDLNMKPKAKRQCHENVACGRWHAEEWSICTRTCGGGFQMRSVVCIEGQACQLEQEPATKRECNTQTCHTGNSAGNLPSTVDVDDVVEEKNNNDDDINLLNSDDNFKSEDHHSGTMKNSDVHHSSDDTSSTAKPKNERLKDLKPKMKDEFKKSNIIYTKKLQYTIKPDFTPETMMYNATENMTKLVSGEDAKHKNGHLKDESASDTANSIDILSSTEGTPSDNHMWVPLFWGECSSHCGAGVKKRLVKCFNKITLEEDKEGYCVKLSKPVDSQDCNNSPCLEWSVSEWGQCSESCDNGTQWRTVDCPEENMCDPLTRPHDNQPCLVRKCVDWVTGDWGQCTKTCGGGHRTRIVQCIDLRAQMRSDSCQSKYKPSHLKRCSTEPCAKDNEAHRKRMSYVCYSDILSQHVCNALKHMGRCWHNVVQFKCCQTCQAHKRRSAGHRKSNHKRRSS